MKILFLGSDGQLGKSLRKRFQESENDCYFFNRNQLDITDLPSIKAKFISINPDILINVCAYTAVDKAEENFDEANNVNNISVGNIAKECLDKDCFLIHISTDYVFDGQSRNSYKEDDKKNPTGVYGRTKLDGENKILESGCKFCIIRTSWVFSENGKNFLKTIMKLASERDSISVVSDQIGAPTFTDDISYAIQSILPFIESGEISKEIYHYSGEPFCSWYDFAKSIIVIAMEENMLKNEPILNGILSKDYPTVAIRPMNSRLSSKKFENQYHIKPSNWKNGIREALLILNKGINT